MDRMSFSNMMRRRSKSAHRVKEPSSEVLSQLNTRIMLMLDAADLSFANNASNGLGQIETCEFIAATNSMYCDLNTQFGKAGID